MASYESYARTTEMLRSVIVDQMLQPIAFRHFKEETGTAVREVLPGKHDEVDFATHGFSGYIDPERRRFENPAYEGRGLTQNNIAAEPDAFDGIVDDLYDAYWDTFGELTMAYQRNHPGEPPMKRDDLRESLSSLTEEHELLCADPMLDDLCEAIRDKNYKLAARFLNVDDSQAMFSPGGGHELAALFTNGDVHIVYRDRDIAVLKPEYDHERWAEILSQRRLGRVRITGEVPEEAFVVGIDDTPAGLFAHSVDGTRLDHDQDITREYLHDVMGFDTNYQHESHLPITEGDRLRLQGDLAVRLVNTDVPTDIDAGRVNLPIDNHLAMLTDAVIPEGETLEEEPVRVVVPESTSLNIVHDEHEQVVTEMPAGAYEFYLLRRGLQPRDERPNWPEPTPAAEADGGQRIELS